MVLAVLLTALQTSSGVFVSGRMSSDSGGASAVDLFPAGSTVVQQSAGGVWSDGASSNRTLEVDSATGDLVVKVGRQLHMWRCVRGEGLRLSCQYRWARASRL